MIPRWAAVHATIAATPLLLVLTEEVVAELRDSGGVRLFVRPVGLGALSVLAFLQIQVMSAKVLGVDTLASPETLLAVGALTPAAVILFVVRADFRERRSPDTREPERPPVAPGSPAHVP